MNQQKTGFGVQRREPAAGRKKCTKLVPKNNTSRPSLIGVQDCLRKQIHIYLGASCGRALADKLSQSERLKDVEKAVAEGSAVPPE